MIEPERKQRENVKQFNVALPPTMVAELDEVARQTFTSRSTLLRQGAALVLQGIRQSKTDVHTTDTNG